MKRLDIGLVLKIVFIILYIPLFWFISAFLDINFLDNNILHFISTGVVMDALLIIDIIKNKDYIIYGIESKEKQKFNWLILFALIFIVFWFPYKIAEPLLIYDFPLPIAGLAIYTVLFSFCAGFVYKLVKDYNISEKKLFNFSLKKKYSELDVLSYELKQANGYQKTLVINNNIILLTKAGVFEFSNFKCIGTLKGNINDEKWFVNDKEIKNPFILKDINSYLITNLGIKYEVSGVRLISKGNILNIVEKSKNKDCLTIEQIDKIYNNLMVEYGDNENKIY